MSDDRKRCPACGQLVGATVTAMLAHWTLECKEADEFDAREVVADE